MSDKGRGSPQLGFSPQLFFSCATKGGVLWLRLRPAWGRLWARLSAKREINSRAPVGVGLQKGHLQPVF